MASRKVAKTIYALFFSKENGFWVLMVRTAPYSARLMMSGDTKTLEREIGRQIKVLRALNDWTQGELAQASGLRQNTISSIENGKAQTVENLAAIATACNITLAELVAEAERRFKGAA